MEQTNVTLDETIYTRLDPFEGLAGTDPKAYEAAVAKVFGEPEGLNDSIWDAQGSSGILLDAHFVDCIRVLTPHNKVRWESLVLEVPDPAAFEQASSPAANVLPFNKLERDIQQAEASRRRLFLGVGSAALVLVVAGSGLAHRFGFGNNPQSTADKIFDPIAISQPAPGHLLSIAPISPAPEVTTAPTFDVKTAGTELLGTQFTDISSSEETEPLAPVESAPEEAVTVPEHDHEAEELSANCEQYIETVALYDWNVDTAMKVMEAESGCDPNQLNPENHYDVDGNVYCVGSAGLFQLSCHDGLIYNAIDNIAKAYEKFKASGWKIWGVCTDGKVVCR